MPGASADADASLGGTSELEASRAESFIFNKSSVILSEVVVCGANDNAVEGPRFSLCYLQAREGIHTL